MEAATVIDPPATVTPLTSQPSSNGSGPELPVDSFRDAAPLLRRPFAANAVRFKVQATWPKGDPKNALVVAYIDARLAAERLNAVCPHLWHDRYQQLDGALMCKLTVDGITRRDVGEGYTSPKALHSDAFKRAAVKFGVGVSLYAIPKIVLALADGHVESVESRGKKSLRLTAAGEKRCREIYAEWLEKIGAGTFGEPLDHGDVEGSVGDPDAGAEHLPPEAEQAALGETIDDERLEAIEKKLRSKRLTIKQIDVLLGAAGLDGLRGHGKRSFVTERLGELTPSEADKLEAEVG